MNVLPYVMLINMAPLQSTVSTLYCRVLRFSLSKVLFKKKKSQVTEKSRSPCNFRDTSWKIKMETYFSSPIIILVVLFLLVFLFWWKKRLISFIEFIIWSLFSNLSSWKVSVIWVTNPTLLFFISIQAFKVIPHTAFSGIRQNFIFPIVFWKYAHCSVNCEI